MAVRKPRHLSTSVGKPISPGSPAAVRAGCTCPVVDNAERPDGYKVMNAGCPVHGVKVEPSVPLCHRCEERARFAELGHAARYECGQIGQAVCSCYMYRAVRPVVLAPLSGERRPILAGWAFAGRAMGVGVVEWQPRAAKVEGGVVMHYAPPSRKAPSKRDRAVAKSNAKRKSLRPNYGKRNPLVKKGKRGLTKAGQRRAKRG